MIPGLLVETEVNQQILDNNAVATALMKPEDAIQQGALALFGEKYGEEVADEMRDNYVRKLTQTPDGVTMPEPVLAYYESWDTLEPYWNAYQGVLPENQWEDWKVYQNRDHLCWAGVQSRKDRRVDREHYRHRQTR